MFRNKRKTQRGIAHGWRWLGDVWEGHGEGAKSERQASSMYQTLMWIAVTWGPRDTLGLLHTSQGGFELLGLKLELGNCILSRIPGLWSILERPCPRGKGSLLYCHLLVPSQGSRESQDRWLLCGNCTYSPALHVNPLEMTSLLRL